VRAVLDTNVLISAFVFPGGTPEAVYRLALEGQLEIGTSRSLLAEFGRVLGAEVRMGA
jgi:putative PIN family toxin of toxin-antitoxin system